MLPVESNVRLTSEVKDVEFTRHVEIVKKEKKRKDSERSDESENKHKKKHKKERKKDKKSKKRRGESEGEELEAGELVEPHPLVTLTNIDPDEIPDQPANKFLMRGDPKKDNDRSKRRDTGNDRDRRYQRRQRGWGGDFYRRRKTKSGRIVKGRGQIHFRTPSRSRSRSITPIHWRKEEARVIKMSDLEKLDAERKRLDAVKSVNGKERSSFDRQSNSTDREQQSYTPKRKRNSNIDYNALDYEEPAYAEHEVKKQVPSLVQYPLPGAHSTFKTAEEVEEDLKKEEESQEEVAAINKRSDFLALALGVQIKTGEDPPENEMVLSGISKQNRKFNPQHPGNVNRANQDRFSGGRFSDEGRFYRPPIHYQKEALRHKTPPIPQIASKVEERKTRNKFETEKKVLAVESQIIHRNGRFDDIRRGMSDWRQSNCEGKGRYERGRDRRRGAHRQSMSRERRRSRSSSKGSKSRRRSRSPRKSRSPDIRRVKSPRTSRSPRRSRSNNRSKKRSGSRKRSRSRSSRTPNRAKSAEKRTRKDSESDKNKVDLMRIDKDAEEKYKKLLILRKKMELLEFKKKKEEEQKFLEEKQRKAKEESEMLEKAKSAKREALEKEKLMKSYKVLQDLDGKKNITKRSRSSSSSSYDSDSTSSSSSSSSSSSVSSSGTSGSSSPRKKDKDASVKSKKKEERRSRSRSRRRSSERKLKGRSRSPDRKQQRPYRK